jgi:hypothetical protein
LVEDRFPTHRFDLAAGWNSAPITAQSYPAPFARPDNGGPGE